MRLHILELAATPLTPYPAERRQRLERYLAEARSNTQPSIWAQSTVGALRLALRYDELLWARGVDGSVAEIGVLDGAFLIGLTQLLPDGAVASVLAIDCFDIPHYTPDPAGHGSGRASLDRFRGNISRHAAPLSHLVILQADSIQVNAADVTLAAPVKLFSVDGLHTEGHAFHDLQLAADLLAPGGVIFVDDYPNHGCPGVRHAVTRFMADSEFLPVCVSENKLVLAHWDHAPAYYLSFP